MNAFGVRPWLAEEPSSPTILAALESETSLMPSDSERLERWMSALILFGVSVGSSWKPIAAAPATIGAAIEVPPARMYCPSTMQVGHSAVNALVGARLETMREPGAYTSGFE